MIFKFKLTQDGWFDNNKFNISLCQTGLILRLKQRGVSFPANAKSLEVSLTKKPYKDSLKMLITRENHVVKHYVYDYQDQLPLCEHRVGYLYFEIERYFIKNNLPEGIYYLTFYYT